MFGEWPGHTPQRSQALCSTAAASGGSCINSLAAFRSSGAHLSPSPSASVHTCVRRVSCPHCLAPRLHNIKWVHAQPGDSAAEPACRPEGQQAVAAGGAAPRFKPLSAGWEVSLSLHWGLLGKEACVRAAVRYRIHALTLGRARPPQLLHIVANAVGTTPLDHRRPAHLHASYTKKYTP